MGKSFLPSIIFFKDLEYKVLSPHIKRVVKFYKTNRRKHITIRFSNGTVKEFSNVRESKLKENVLQYIQVFVVKNLNHEVK